MMMPQQAMQDRGAPQMGGAQPQQAMPQEEGMEEMGEQSGANMDAQMVSTLTQRFLEKIPSIQQMAGFEKALEQNPELAQVIVYIMPELVAGFMGAAKVMQGEGGADTTKAMLDGSQGMPQGGQRGGMNPPGGANGAMAQPRMGGAPPSMPDEGSPIRKAYYTGQ